MVFRHLRAHRNLEEMLTDPPLRLLYLLCIRQTAATHEHFSSLSNSNDNRKKYRHKTTDLQKKKKNRYKTTDLQISGDCKKKPKKLGIQKKAEELGNSSRVTLTCPSLAPIDSALNTGVTCEK